MVGIILIGHLVACLSPGPDIGFVIHSSAKNGLRAGLAAVGGILLGVLVQSIVVTFGLLSPLLSQPKAQAGFQLLGGTYLITLGTLIVISLLKTQQKAEAPSGRNNSKTPFLAGFLINITNLKAWLYFVSLFSTQASTLGNIKMILPLLIVLVQGLAFSGIALAIARFQNNSPHFGKLSVLNWACAVFFIFLGLKLWIDFGNFLMAS